MKILHTSDWHLGRTLHGENLHAYQEIFHEFLIRTVREHGVDAVVIAGDVYDRSVPPVESVELLHSTLARLAELTTVIMTPGNHDSAVRLGFGAKLMRQGVHILASAEGIEHPVSVMDEHGEVLVFGLPFLDPDVARYRLVAADSDPLERSHEAVMRVAMDRVRAKVAQAVPGTRSIVLAHTFIAGGEGSDSERDLTVGGVDCVPGSVFEGVDYVALGHLHGCQNMSGLVPGERPVAWYSGSPLAFSFSERGHKKAVLLVEMEADGSCAVTPLPVPVARALTRIEGSLEHVLAQAGEHGDDWVHAIIREEARPAHLQETLRARFPHLLMSEFVSTKEGGERRAPAVARAAKPSEVVGDFFEYLTGASPTAERQEIIEDMVVRARRSTSEVAGAERRTGRSARQGVRGAA